MARAPFACFILAAALSTATSQAPPADPCLKKASSCGGCLGGACGWCASANECQSGNAFGPTYGLTPPSNCATWSWYWFYCPGTPEDDCSKLLDCTSCIDQGSNLAPCCKAPCGWCTSSDGITGSCQSGSLGGPWGPTRCKTNSLPYWVWSQFDTSAQCPSVPSSSRSFSSSTSRSSSALAPSASASSGAVTTGSETASQTAGSSASSSPVATTTSATPSESSGSGGGGSDNSRSVDSSALIGGLAGALAAVVVSLCIAAIFYSRMRRSAGRQATEVTAMKSRAAAAGADITLSPLTKAQTQALPGTSPQDERRDRVAALARSTPTKQQPETY